MRKRMLASAWALLFLATGSTPASPLAPVGVAGSVSFNIPPGIDIGALGTYSLSGAPGSVLLTAAGTPSPSVFADAQIVPFFFGRAVGTVLYEMEILGPDGDVGVSIGVSGSVTGNSELLSGDTFAGFALSSRWRFETTGGVPLIEEGITTPSLTGSFSQNFGQTHNLTLTANRVYRVSLTADASARAASASAFIDPIFTFGPGVGPEYSFHFSEGIGNSAVPEPDSLALIAAGMIVLPWCRNRRASKTGSVRKFE